MAPSWCAWVQNPNSISIGSAVFAQLMAECHWACPDMSFPLKIAPWHRGIWTPSTTWFLEAPTPTTQTDFDRFSHLFTAHCRVLSGMCRYVLSLKHCPFAWEIWIPSNTRFLWPTQVLNPNGISVGSAIFAGLTTVTDRPQTTLLGL